MTKFSRSSGGTRVATWGFLEHAPDVVVRVPMNADGTRVKARTRLEYRPPVRAPRTVDGRTDVDSVLGRGHRNLRLYRDSMTEQATDKVSNILSGLTNTDSTAPVAPDIVNSLNSAFDDAAQKPRTKSAEKVKSVSKSKSASPPQPTGGPVGKSPPSGPKTFQDDLANLKKTMRLRGTNKGILATRSAALKALSGRRPKSNSGSRSKSL